MIYNADEGVHVFIWNESVMYLGLIGSTVLRTSAKRSL